jgi:hypothetical protein
MKYVRFECDGVTYEAALVAIADSGVWVSLVTIQPAFGGRIGVKRFLSAGYQIIEKAKDASYHQCNPGE